MARRRDVVIGIIIAISFILAMGFFGLILLSSFAPEGEFQFSSLTGDQVGVAELSGVINEESARPLIKQIDSWAQSGAIKAIVVHVDSPGGVVAPSQEIYDAILRAKKEKPVVVSMASVAASGGYYVSCAADKIMADPGTITGSIGVIFEFHVFKGLMDKVGVTTEVVKSGDMKDVGTYARPMTEKERQMLHSLVMDTYEQFVDVVATGRKMERDAVYPLADGSVYTGLQAYSKGLVDTLGGLQEAIDLAAKMGGITGEPNVVRPANREKISIFDLLGRFIGNVNATVENNSPGPQLLYLFR
jgi:protease-4